MELPVICDAIAFMWYYCTLGINDGASNHQPHICLLIRLFRPRSKKISKLRVTGLNEGNSPVTGEQRSVRRSFDIFFDLRLNKAVKESALWTQSSFTGILTTWPSTYVSPAGIITTEYCMRMEISVLLFAGWYTFMGPTVLIRSMSGVLFKAVLRRYFCRIFYGDLQMSK